MTADPTPAPYPRLAELPEQVAAMCEALHGTGVGCPYDEHWRAQEHDAEWHGLHAIAILARLPARTATTEAEALAALRVLRKAAFAAGKHIVVTTDYPQGVEAFNRLCEAIDVADAALAATGMSESKKHSDLGGDE
jgi:hypothetical protein